MRERGATREEVERAILEGEVEPALKGRLLYRYNFEFNSTWLGERYAVKQVVPVVAEEENRRVVVTVYTFYY